MPTLKPIRIQNFEGGLYLGERTLAADNQLTLLENWFYNSDKKLQTRRGKRNFGSPIPDFTKIIHACDALTGSGTWTAADDAVTLTVDTTTKVRGAGALKFNITVATSGNNFATLTNSTIPALSIVGAKGSVRFWVFVPTGGLTNLTDCRLQVGSSSSNYYEITILPAQLKENTWNLVKGTYGIQTGTPVDTAITFLLFRVNYTSGYTDKTGWQLDDIVAYSATATKPIISLKYFEESKSPFSRHLMAQVGNGFYEYDESSKDWTLFKGGLTEGARFSMDAYKNIMNFSNGVDNYFDYDGETATDRTGANTYKAKYLLQANDVGYALGDPAAPSSLAYTNGTPANFQNYPNVLVLDEDGSDGKGTGLINLGPIVIACKERKIYKVNIAAPSREQIDYSDGFLAHRALVRVENEVFGSNKKGVYTVAQREGTIGSLRADPLTNDLQPLMDTITNHEICSAIYISKLNNFYYFFDTTGNGAPDSCIVLSILTRKWSQYTNMNANEAVLYRDKNGDEHLLLANSIGGQCQEIETGFNDNDIEIRSVLETKDFDFGVPETYKTFEMVEIHGFINDVGEFDFNAIIDDADSTATATVKGINYVTTVSDYSFGSYAFGDAPYGGDNTGTNLYPFVARIPMCETGQRIRLRIDVNKKNSVVILTKASIYPYSQPLDVFNFNYQY